MKNIHEINPPSNELGITTFNILKSIKYNEKTVPQEFKETIESELLYAKNHFEAKAGYKVINDFDISENLIIDQYTFEIGQELKAILTNSEQLVLFTCTAGHKISQRHQELAKQNLTLNSYANDIIGNYLVEKTADYLLKQIQSKFAPLKATNRYSPGNCGWEIMNQKDFFSLFPNNFIGVTIGDSQMMNPLKSINGIIGIGKKVKYRHNTCNLCNSVGCIYRRSFTK